MNKLFFKCLLMTLSLGLLGCQSVDYYGKSYEKNGFFHCMMLEYAVSDMEGSKTEDDKKSCQNYKEKLQKTLTNRSLFQEENYYKQYGAICKTQKNILECEYNANVKQNVMYDAYVYRLFKISLKSNINNSTYTVTVDDCQPSFTECNHTAFLGTEDKKIFTIIKK